MAGFTTVGTSITTGRKQNVRSVKVLVKLIMSPSSHRKHYHARDATGKLNHTPTYTSWREMKRRCLDPNRKDFKWYGERGIQVCPRWLGPDGFLNFLADMGEAPVGLTIDRIDFHGHYEPGNCKWSNRDTQNKNRRKPDREYDPEDWRIMPKWPELVVEIYSPPDNNEEIPF